MTVMISLKVRDGREDDYWSWQESVNDVAAWLNSSACQELLDKGRSLFDGPARQEVLARQAPPRDVVTAVVSHVVRPGREQGFIRWREKARRAQERASGFIGFELFRPVPGIQVNWVAMLRFDTRKHLDEWLQSDTRNKLLEEGRDHFADYDLQLLEVLPVADRNLRLDHRLSRRGRVDGAARGSICTNSAAPHTSMTH